MKTKKKFTTVFSVMLAVLIIVSLAACGNNEVPSTDSSSSQSENQNPTSSSDTNVPDNSTAQGENKILIAYFSRWGNTEYPDNVDASTSASIVIDGERFGTTEYVARMIQETVGGDIHLIETATPYTADFDELRDVNHNEMSNNILPELKESNLDIAKYDTVFIGYPVWATDVPQAVISFLNQYDLSGKTVIPFCTHDGYGAGSSYSTIRDASKAEKTLDGLAIEAKDVPGAKDTVTSMQGGLVYGYIGQTEYIIRKMKEESGLGKINVVATGGLGKMIAKETSFINYYDANLTLKGLQIIYDKQKQD